MFSSNAAQITDAAFIEDVFSTWLYTGTGTTQTINNGIDLAGKGGLIWIKDRSRTANHKLIDTARSSTVTLATDLATHSTGEFTNPTFLSTGFSLPGFVLANEAPVTYASWTFREQPKFFDVVTYTGNGANRTIAHSLGSVPGCIIVKRTDSTGDWQVYHRSLANTQYMVLNSTAAAATGATRWNSTEPTNAVFSLGTDATVNASGGTYVAYLFAHDAGGFGASGADNVISCGSYTGNGSATGPVVTLGWEPQWLLIKRSNGTGDWNLIDNMRGFVVGGTDSELNPNLSAAESTGIFVTPTATGFQLNTTDAGYNASGGTYIYIAIRRGPMRTPTSGASVFSAKTYAATTTSAQVTHDVTFDAEINANRSVNTQKFLFVDSLRGINGLSLISYSTGIENNYSNYWSRRDQRTMAAVSAFDSWWAASSGTENHISYGLVRAPGFFDVVCYTGDGAGSRAVNHNLGTAPSAIFIKRRDGTSNWGVGMQLSSPNNEEGRVLASAAGGFNLNTTGGTTQNVTWVGYAVSSTTFDASVIGGGIENYNVGGATYVAYLFGSCPGVSRVGNYTGTGATQTINCGFSSGARFVLIKRTDAAGDWYVWDSARGIVAGNDPYLLLNSFAPEVTNTDWVDAAASGFELSNAAGNLVNTSGGSYIFLAIA